MISRGCNDCKHGQTFTGLGDRICAHPHVMFVLAESERKDGRCGFSAVHFRPLRAKRLQAPQPNACASCAHSEIVKDSVHCRYHSGLSLGALMCRQDENDCGPTARFFRDAKADLRYQDKVQPPGGVTCFSCLHCASPGSSMALCRHEATVGRCVEERFEGTACGRSGKLFVSRFTEGQQVAQALAESIL